ncbi:MAG: HAD family hydrolase [Treponemataceae bacterium]|nr:HAD family hydrolase [Treponemataceae bacterium]
MKFDSVILDIDGTIWNTTAIVAEAWNKAIEESGFPLDKVTDKILQGEFGRTMDVIAMDLWPDLNDSDRAELLKKACHYEDLAVEENQENITYPNVVSTVKKLSERVDFYVVSNCQKGYIELMLKKTGLESFVKDHVCFGDNGFTKGQNVKLIVERNKMKKPVYIGDTQGDCDACKEAGIPFIYVKYGFGQADSKFAELSDFSQLEEFV